jgi:hypothetical protein
VRLIIWETREVPLVDGDSVDIYLKAIFSQDSLNSHPVTKQTDIHYACKDGRGIFNYRMKFDLQMPSDFPRIKLQLYDHNMITDEALGEAMLNIKNTVLLLQKHGSMEMRKVWTSFTKPGTT